MAKRKQEFYIRTTEGWMKQEGYLVTVEGTEFFIYKSDSLKDKRNPWVVTHGRSGLKVASRRTKKEATEALKYLVQKYGIDMISKRAEEAIQGWCGVSPRYSA